MHFPLGSCFCLCFSHTQGILIIFHGKSRTNGKFPLTLCKVYHNWLIKWIKPTNYFNMLIQCVMYYITAQMSSPEVFMVCASCSTANCCLKYIETRNFNVWASDCLLVEAIKLLYESWCIGNTCNCSASVMLASWPQLSKLSLLKWHTYLLL